MCESENEAHKVAWIAEACRVQGYRQRNSLHVTMLAKGLRIRRYPGGGRHKRTAVLSRRCGPAEGQRMDGRVPGWADGLGQQLSMLRARQREGQKSVDERLEGSWANRGRRQEEVSIGSAGTSYLPVYPAVLRWVGRREAGCGLGGQSLGIVVCRPTRPMAGVAV